MTVIALLIAILFLVGTHYMAYTRGEEAGFKRFIKVQVEDQRRKDEAKKESEEK